MPENEEQSINQSNYEEYFNWRIPEYEQHQRGFWWYCIVSVIVLGLSGLSIFTPNFLFNTPNYLFLIIVILTAAILIVINNMSGEVEVAITSEGLAIGDRFYDYDEFKNFCVLFKPRENLKVLYLEFKGVFKPRLQVPLMEMDPVTIRQALKNFLDEDLNRTDESSIDFLSKILKF